MKRYQPSCLLLISLLAWNWIAINCSYAQTDTLLWQYTWKPIDQYRLYLQKGHQLDTLWQFVVWYPIKQGFSPIFDAPSQLILKQKIFQIHHTAARKDTQPLTALAMPSGTALITAKDTFWLHPHGLKHQQKLLLRTQESSFWHEKGQQPTTVFYPSVEKGVYRQYWTTTPTNLPELPHIAYFVLLNKLQQQYLNQIH